MSLFADKWDAREFAGNKKPPEGGKHEQQSISSNWQAYSAASYNLVPSCKLNTVLD